MLKNLFGIKKDKEEQKEEVEAGFIDPYAYCIINPYFKSSEDFSKIFSDFENRISSLQRYFETNQLHIKNYLKFSKESLNQKKKEIMNKKELAAYGRCHFSDEEYFYEMHYLSVILMMFSLFENLLSDLSIDVAKSENKRIENYMDKSLPYINRYLNFLTNECNLDIFISEDQYSQIDIIRKIRNNYLHSLEKDIPEEIQEELKTVLELDKNKIRINSDFILMSFRLIGDIVTNLEKSYWKYKRKKYKIK